LIANSNKETKVTFLSIVRLALADGFFAPEEKRVLDKLAIRLEISIAEYVEILENLQSTLSTSLLKLNEISVCTI
jgi:predicted DNA binding protein